MNCPSCYALLSPVKYEGLPVFKCSECDGYLVSNRRVDDIQRRLTKTQSELNEESRGTGTERADNPNQLLCPRCHLPMEKEIWKKQGPFQIDKCLNCDVVWFDAGELAMVQLQFEEKPQTIEIAHFQDRQLHMTDEERQEFEKNLAKLPEGEATYLSGFGQGLMGSMKSFCNRLKKR